MGLACQGLWAKVEPAFGGASLHFNCGKWNQILGVIGFALRNLRDGAPPLPLTSPPRSPLDYSEHDIAFFL